MGKFIPDVDIDVADRNIALKTLLNVPASRLEGQELIKHNVGVYFQDIPVDPITGLSSIPYKEAEERGYFKVDFLNLNLYKEIDSMEHLDRLLDMEPTWELLEYPEITKDLFQLGGNIDGIETSELLKAYKPTSVMDLAIFLALIRPRKKHLLGEPWDKIKEEIWKPGDESLYGFKKAHAVSYAHVILVQMNLLVEKSV